MACVQLCMAMGFVEKNYYYIAGSFGSMYVALQSIDELFTCSLSSADLI